MTGEQLYWELSRQYSSPHNDTSYEMNEAVLELNEALGKGLTPQYVQNKMAQLITRMREDGNNFKSHLAAVIKNRFWDKTFIERIPYKPFMVEEQ